MKAHTCAHLTHESLSVCLCLRGSPLSAYVEPPCVLTCSIHAAAPLMCLLPAGSHSCSQLITQLLTSGTCSVDATAHATAPWMRRLTHLLRGCDTPLLRGCDGYLLRGCDTHLLRGCDGALHASGGLRGVDKELPCVRSARGLQGRQELGRMLVCVTDFVLRQAL